MKVIVNQPVGTQLFFDVDASEYLTIAHIAKLVETEEGIPANFQLYSIGKETWAEHSDRIAPFVKDNEELELDLVYDLDGQGGLRCETTKPHCGINICCLECRCIKKYDIACCCCEMGCSIM